MIIAGLDLSLASTGLAVVCTDYELGDTVALHRLQPRKLAGHQRLAWLMDEISMVRGVDVAVIEGPSYGSTGGSAHERAGLWWLTAHFLWLQRIPYAVVAPAGLKKYATGYGAGPKSGKDQVLIAVTRRYPEISVDGNDTADALVLAAMAADHYGTPLAKVPELNRKALAGVSWPALP